MDGTNPTFMSPNSSTEVIFIEAAFYISGLKHESINANQVCHALAMAHFQLVKCLCNYR